MAILCIVCAWHAVLAVILEQNDEDTAKTADKYALITLAVVYVAFNLGYFLYIHCVVS